MDAAPPSSTTSVAAAAAAAAAGMGMGMGYGFSDGNKAAALSKSPAAKCAPTSRKRLETSVMLAMNSLDANRSTASPRIPIWSDRSSGVGEVKAFFAGRPVGFRSSFLSGSHWTIMSVCAFAAAFKPAESSCCCCCCCALCSGTFPLPLLPPLSPPPLAPAFGFGFEYVPAFENEKEDVDCQQSWLR